MYRKFEVLDRDKKERILNAVFEEFAEKRFKEASTDAIAVNARISKGALFQYFGTKKQLYLYAAAYGERVLFDEFLHRANLEEPDLLLRLRSVFEAKMQIYCKYPRLFEFLVYAHTRETDKELTDEAARTRESKKNNLYGKIYDNIDYTLFRNDIDPARAVAVITYTVEGYSTAEIAKLSQMKISEELYSAWLSEMDEFLSLLRKVFYREEQEYAKRD